MNKRIDQLFLHKSILAHALFIGVLTIGLVQRIGPLFDLGESRNRITEHQEYFDLYYHFLEGQRLAQGINPYERVLSSDRIKNDKYPGYFPLLYLIGAALFLFGVHDFFSIFLVCKGIGVFADMGVASILYFVSVKQQKHSLGLFASALWLLNRWTLYSTDNASLDTAIVFLLVLSLVLLPRRPIVGYLAFSLSLALKQFGILLLPLYLLEGRDLKNCFRICAYILGLPLLLSIPFLLLEPYGFFLSLSYDGIRTAITHGDPWHPFGFFVGNDGFLSRLPTIIMLLVVYVLAFHYRLNQSLSSFLVFASFIAFNPVVFNQYYPYLFPFGLLWIIQSCNPHERR